MIEHSRIKRILIVRTDRIGDVVLSTPIARVLRNAFPGAWIAFMTGPKTRDCLVANPHIDEVIVYDKLYEHRSVWRTLCFAFLLRKKSFDTAFILHTTNRVLWTTAVAGIRNRIGYARRLTWLLTERLPYTKPEGKKHEAEYNLDLVKLAGVKGHSTSPVWVVLPSEEEDINRRLEQAGVKKSDRIVTVHPDASTASKRWAPSKFEALCKKLVGQPDKKIVLVAGTGSKALTRSIACELPGQILDWGGRLNLRQLAALLKRSAYMISNDSGPMHISTAVGTPVVAIFGRKQPGLGARRWGPVGKRDVVLQKDPGCDPCIPDPCPIQLECLEALSVDEVVEAARSLEITHA